MRGFCFSPHIIQRSVEDGVWAGNVSRMMDKRSAYRILVGEPEVRRVKALAVNGKIILKFILNKYNGRA